MPLHAVPTVSMQNLLEVSMGRTGLVPRVLLMEQEAFRNNTGNLTFPSIIHTATDTEKRRSQHGEKTIRATFAVRIHAETRVEVDRIHASIEDLAPEVNGRITVSLVAEDRADNLDGTYWRLLEVSLPGRGLRALPVPRNRRVNILWGGDKRIRWGNDKRIQW